MESFYSRWKCGKKKKLVDLGDEGTLISGIRVMQHKDFSFTWHMEEYVNSKLSLIDTPRGFMSETTELDDTFMNKVVSLSGKIGWLGSNGRPDAAAGHSIIAGEYKHKSPQLITMCNQVVKQCKAIAGQTPSVAH